MISEEFFESETVVLGIGRGRLSSEQAALVTPTDTVLNYTTYYLSSQTPPLVRCFFGLLFHLFFNPFCTSYIVFIRFCFVVEGIVLK